MMNDVSEKQKTEKKIHRNMAQYGVKGGKKVKKQQKTQNLSTLEINQDITLTNFIGSFYWFGKVLT